MVPNQVRYQLRHIPIGRKGIKKFGLFQKTPYLCIPLAIPGQARTRAEREPRPVGENDDKRLQALAETVREGLCNSRSKR